jgi:hypothetical protein
MEAIEDTFAGVIEGMLDSAGDARMEQGASATTADYLAAEHRAIIISQASLRGAVQTDSPVVARTVIQQVCVFLSNVRADLTLIEKPSIGLQTWF